MFGGIGVGGFLQRSCLASGLAGSQQYNGKVLDSLTFLQAFGVCTQLGRVCDEKGNRPWNFLSAPLLISQSILDPLVARSEVVLIIVVSRGLGFVGKESPCPTVAIFS
uniref:Uncharacterized protein n=1 Tax=Candidozyma auris TaxID=498019 RepID=A0A0L0NS93_CANAR